ncbi:MAG: DGQHR domain-containing protein [Gammaproteobacteria bacterium]|nr:DGQHR domain-containing protein [Gammaproteobacteria bacterium]
MIHEELLLPALRAKMGDWTYYIASMTLRELAQRVTTVGDFHWAKNLDEELQRSLSPRARDIADYLISQPQRLFGTLVVGVYGGEPEWLEVEISSHARPWDEGDERLNGIIGLLRLSGSEQLFALDGQHRLVGTVQALKDDPSLGTEEVAVIFVGHSKDQAGLERTRRLFSTLNRYAKPVSKRDIIALDEDDAVAIVTRRLVDRHPLFAGRVALGKTKAVRVADGVNFTSIVALYDCVEMVLKLNSTWNPRHKKVRPKDEILNPLTQHCMDYWNIVLNEHQDLQSYIVASTDSNPAQLFRGRHGGHLLFRPIGLLAYTWAATSLCAKEKADTRAAIQRLAGVPMDLAQAPWPGLLWDKENQRMITSPEAQRVARRLIYHSVGGALKHLWTDATELRRELAGLLNRPIADVELPRYDA